MNTIDLDLLARVVYRLAQKQGVANPLPGDGDVALMNQFDDDMATLANDVADSLNDD